MREKDLLNCERRREQGQEKQNEIMRAKKRNEILLLWAYERWKFDGAQNSRKLENLEDKFMGRTALWWFLMSTYSVSPVLVLITLV